MTTDSAPLCAIAGTGPGNGAAFARRFAAAGYRTLLLARTDSVIGPLAGQLPGARAMTCDLDDAAAVSACFERARDQLGPVDTLIYNASDRYFGGLEQTDAAQFEQAWRTTAYGCFNCARAVAGDLRAAGRGNLIVIGATAAWKGAAGFVGFCAAKAAQRSLAQ